MRRTYTTLKNLSDNEAAVICISVQEDGKDYEIVLTWKDFSRLMGRTEPWTLFVSIACDALDAFNGLSDVFNLLKHWHNRDPQPADLYEIFAKCGIEEGRP